MPDDLRTRIAAVARSFLLDHFIVDHEQAQGLWPEYLADAVIRELRLREEVDLNCTDEGETISLYRYVTEWTADE